MKTNLDCYLKVHRRRCGLTQRELASLVGCETGGVVSRLERIRRHPTLETAYALELILGVASFELFPGLYANVKKAVSARAYNYYDALQGNSSRATKLKLDLLEEVLARVDQHAKPGRA